MTSPRLRRIVLGWALLLAPVLSACSGPPAPAPVASTTAPGATLAPSPSPTRAGETPRLRSCQDLAAGLSRREQIGQLLMLGTYHGSAAERAQVKKYRLGSVILLGNSTAGVKATAAEAKRLTAVAQRIPLLVAADQEGGLVQRLQGPGFDRIPSAREQARLSDAELTRRATRWGEQLRRAGVRYDLAPVADVVPASWESRNDPIGRLRRGYGTSPSLVSAKVAAFRKGLAAAGVAAAVKHFPGIGRVRGNTDFRAGVVDTLTTGDDPLLAPFRAASGSGVESIMVSTVTYRQIDPRNPAVFSRAVITILRADYGFDGVVISDDLGAAASMRPVPPRERALRFLKAGGDLTINAEPKLTAAMAEGLAEAAAGDPEIGSRITESAGRVLALKAGLGLVRCGA